MLFAMTRRRLINYVLILAGASLVALLCIHRIHTPAAQRTPAVPKVNAHATPNMPAPAPTVVATETAEQQLIKIGLARASAEDAANLLKKLYSENPQQLFDALIAIGNAPIETRRLVVPVLANALVLWPDAEGRYVFPVADAYGEIDLPSAGEWAATYLAKTQREDIAAATLVARLAETSEARALVLLGNLPDAARLSALQSLPYHLRMDDLDHLYSVCLSLDPRGDAGFTRLVFQRLGTERLDETATWLSNTPEAQAIRGAVASIAQAIVQSGDPKKAITWADALSDKTARAQAICSVYQQWAQISPEHAIDDILGAYDGAPMLMTDVFQGAAAHHGSGPAEFWETARNLQNPSARAYAISALISPMLVTLGPAATEAKIETLASGSLERNVAELTFQNGLKNPALMRELDGRFHTTTPSTN